MQDVGRELDVSLPPGKTSPFGAVFIIVNASLGAGLLAFPVAFQWAGGVLQALLAMSVSVCVYTSPSVRLAPVLSGVDHPQPPNPCTPGRDSPGLHI